MKKTGILIPVFNNLSYTKTCLKNLEDNLRNTDGKEWFEIILIDDGSTDGTSEWVRKNYPDVHLLQGDGKLWWSGGINKGARYALNERKCNNVLLWNNDIQTESDYFGNLINAMQQYDDNTLIGSKVYTEATTRTIWTMGGEFNPKTGYWGMKAYMVKDSHEYQTPLEADWLTGMGTLVPGQVIHKNGFWNEVDFPQYHGDTEFSYRAKLNGCKIIVEPSLVMWNDTENTGLNHQGNFRKLMQMTNDKRSLYNLKVNLRFYKLYAKSWRAYLHLLRMYFRLFGGFLKWKVVNLLSQSGERHQ